MDSKNKNIVDFYVAANANKYTIVKQDPIRDYSKAEITVLACLDALFTHDYVDPEHDYDVHKVIKMILLDSVRDYLPLLPGSKKFQPLLDELDTKLTRETIQAKTSVFKTIIDSKGDNEELNTLLRNFKQLQTQIRKGHIYWAAKGDRIESDLEHTYGTLLIALGINCEYDYAINFDEIYETLLIHETDEIIIGDPTEFDGITKEERRNLTNNAVVRIFGNTKNGKHHMGRLQKFEDGDTIEGQYEHTIDKLEYDMQVKMYQMQGRYDFVNRPSNVATQSPRVLSIIAEGANDTFEVHYQYDKYRYRDFPCLRRMLEITRNL